MFRTWQPARLALVACVLTPGVCEAAEVFIDSNASGPGDGSVFDPYSSIQYALDQPATLDGDALILLPGVYAESINLTKNVSLVSPTPDAATLLSPDGFTPVLVISQLGSVELDGLLVDGHCCANGIVISDATVLIKSCRIVDCSTGIEVADSHVTLVDSDFSDDSDTGVRAVGSSIEIIGGTTSAPYYDELVDLDDCVATIKDWSPSGTAEHGFELLTASNTTLSIENCMFLGPGNWDDGACGLDLTDCNTSVEDTVFDHSGYITALRARGGSITVQNCEFVGQEASAVYLSGGVNALLEDTVIRENQWSEAFISTEPSSLTLRRVSFLNNSSDWFFGGAVVLLDGPATLEHCVFDNNVYWGGSDYSDTGAILDATSAVTAVESVFSGNRITGIIEVSPAIVCGANLVNCTVVSNNAATYTDGGTVNSALTFGGLLSECIAWNNSPTNFAGATAVVGSNIQGGWPGLGNIDVNPRFCAPEFDDYRLRRGSPAAGLGAFPDPTWVCEPPLRSDEYSWQEK